MRIFRKILIALAVAFIAIQFVRPVKNISTGPAPADIAAKYAVPKDVQGMLHRACYDCHSNHTRYPWYANVQPAAWWLATHVRDGKKHLNFSEFGNYSKARAASKLGGIVDEVEEGRMPLKSYTPMHPEAKLTPEEVKKLVAWAEALSDELAEN